MVLIAVLCPSCQSAHVIKGGKNLTGPQRLTYAMTVIPSDGHA